MITPFVKSEQLEDYRLKLGWVYTLVTLNGHTTAANITATSSNPGVKVFVEAASVPTPTEDTQTNFVSIDSNAAPAVVGILTLCYDAATFLNAQASVVSSASMTAGVVTKAGSSTSGVTSTLKNLAFTVSCTALDLDASIASHVFQLEQFYLRA